MNWRGQKQSDEIEDRTGQSGGLGGISLAGGGGIGVIVLLLISLFMGGGNTGDVLNNVINTVTQTSPATTGESTADPDEKAFVATVLQDLEDFWQQEAQAEGFTYRVPKLVLYSGTTSTPNGTASKDMGPFYSPTDEKIYLDLSFASELKNTYGASGDYTMAYVLAHEYGHHIQKLLGTTTKLDAQRSRLSTAAYNKLSVRLELQADYYAGMFTKYLAAQTNNGVAVLEPGDFNEALKTAQVIGDDALQKKYQGSVNPESFTHGTSEQRMAWLKAGYTYGDLAHGDTFNARDLDHPED
ncbi:MAG TPA: neutral zinc metallopeptidase [Lactobacillaceae bacterium]|jgi:hypothetical protein